MGVGEGRLGAHARAGSVWVAGRRRRSAAVSEADEAVISAEKYATTYILLHLYR